jgi:hypothetical protein
VGIMAGWPHAANGGIRSRDGRASQKLVDAQSPQPAVLLLDASTSRPPSRRACSGRTAQRTRQSRQADVTSAGQLAESNPRNMPGPPQEPAGASVSPGAGPLTV